MEILIDVIQSPNGRLIGTARMPPSRNALSFSGTMELLASLEELCRSHLTRALPHRLTATSRPPKPEPLVGP